MRDGRRAACCASVAVVAKHKTIAAATQSLTWLAFIDGAV